ncbi:MAG: hypothetical protein WCJ04_14280, partial [Actinomycetes bacterium]
PKSREERSLFEPGATKPRVTPQPAAQADLTQTPAALAQALSSLDPQSVRDASPTFASLIATLQSGEAVTALTQGWVKGSPCVVARTDRRFILVVSRSPQPLVQSLNLSRVELSFGTPDDQGFSALRLIEGPKMLQVQGIRDAAQAQLLRQGHVSQPPSEEQPTDQGFF